MQKPIALLQLEPVFKMHIELDAFNSSQLTGKLFQYVEENKISFELNSKKGSIINEFTINVVAGLFTAVLYDLIKYLFKILKDKKKKGEEIKPAYFFLKDKEYVVTGDRDSKIPEELKKELFEE